MCLTKSVWITWENQRRNREIANSLGVTIFELKEIDNIHNLLKKYINGIYKTFLILKTERPTIIFCQNPSLVLAFFLIFISFFSNKKIIVDAHNAGLFPCEGKAPLLNWLSRFVQKKSALTLVTNQSLAEIVFNNGGNPFVLQDKIPDISDRYRLDLRGDINILFICSFAADEPYEAVFQAANLIDHNICLYVTGNYCKNNIVPPTNTDNLILTGFLPEDEYIAMLQSVDATIDLTSRDNCLVCGAYESVAAGKPMILSNTKALKEYFSMGAIYTGHSPQELANAINQVMIRKESLQQEVIKLKSLRNAEWIVTKNQLLARLEKLAK